MVLRLSALSLVCALAGCVECGEGTENVDGVCVPADEADADTDADADSDTEADADYGEVGPCTPADVWTDGPVPADLLTHTAFDASYDSGLDAVLASASGWGAGSWGTAFVVIDATVVAVGVEPRWDYMTRYYVADGYGTTPIFLDGDAVVGDKVTFSVGGFEGWYGVEMLKDIGSWTVTSSGNPVPVRHLGAATVNYDGFSELVHEAGEIVEVSALDCGTGNTCFVFEHDGVRDRIRVPSLNTFGLDVDYDGGLCGEVIAPAGIYGDSSGVQGYFIDVVEPGWMRVWPKP